jgi:glycosyltransferase involved in cell wall biosynthesis
LDNGCIDRLSHHMVMLDQVFERSDDFDIIHFHVDYLHFPISRWCRVAHVTTLHGRLDLADLPPLYRRFCHEPLISISNAQRTPLAWANWQGTVYHGLPEDLYDFHPHAGRYLAFVGRISPEKRLDRAIEIAQRSGIELRIAAKVDEVDRAYFEQTIRPLIGKPGIQFIGESSDREKNDFFGNAAAVLFPIDWPEPFGLVMIESLACGTPVIAWRCGSVPEIIDHGVSGYMCESIDQAVAAVRDIARLDRARCREVFQTRYNAGRMARDYVRIYQRLIHKDHELEPADHGRNHQSSGSVLHSGDVVASR